MDDNAKEKSKLRVFLIWSIAIVGIMVATILLLIGYWYLVTRCFPAGKPEWGQFGDMFGGATALFSAMAFVGLIIAIILQKKELTLQRLELEQTRAELKGQKEQLELQSKALQKQNFENTFFKMIDHYEKITKRICRSDIKSEDEFTRIYINFCRLYGNSIPVDKYDDYKLVKDVFMKYYAGLPHEFYNYFHIVYNIYKYINRADIDNKGLYASIMRTQLMGSELFLLFYYGLIPAGEKFKLLIEEYSIFKYLNRKEMTYPDHTDYYDPKAFGE